MGVARGPMPHALTLFHSNDDNYAYDCSCGWRGVLWATETGAAREARIHVVPLTEWEREDSDR